MQKLKLVNKATTDEERYRFWYQLPTGNYLLVSYPPPGTTQSELFVVLCERCIDIHPYHTIPGLGNYQWCSQMALDLWLSNQGYCLEVPTSSGPEKEQPVLNLDQTISWKAWRHNAPGDCVCGIKRELCTYHR